jgi:hypothetical protein
MECTYLRAYYDKLVKKGSRHLRAAEIQLLILDC